MPYPKPQALPKSLASHTPLGTYRPPRNNPRLPRLAARMRASFHTLLKPPNLASCIQPSIIEPQPKAQRSRFMCVSGIRNRLVVLLSFFMSIPLISARGQDQRPPATRKGFETHYASPNPYQKWLDEDVRWIIADEERAEYSRLANDQQRAHFGEAL